MTFLEILLFFPEFFLLNFILFYFWICVYEKSKKQSNIENNLQMYPIILLCFVILLVCTAPIFEYSIFLNMIVCDNRGIIWKIMLLFFSIISLLIIESNENFSSFVRVEVEIKVLRLLIIFSLMLIIITNNLILIFFALEIYSLISYILVAYTGKKSLFSAESAVKYFITGTLFSLFLIYGIGLIYSATGVLNINILISLTNFFLFKTSLFFDFGLFFLFCAILFKVAAAPFHFWAPDVYEGSSISTMFFLNVAPKVSIFSLLYKLAPLIWGSEFLFLFLFSAIFSVFIGSLGGIFQKRVKRLIVYSSINNTGFLLFSLLSIQYFSSSILFIYLLSYLISLCGLFGILLTNNVNLSFKIINNIHGLSNFGKTHPVRSLYLSVFIFASAGLPPFINFISKFLVMNSLSIISNNYLFIIILSLIFSTFSVFYYIRIVKLMYFIRCKYVLNLKQINKTTALILSVLFLLVFLLFPICGVLFNFFDSF